MKSIIQFSKLLSLFLFTALLSTSCNNDDETPDPAIDCSVEVAECLTNGSAQTYINYSSDGNLTTNACFQSIQMNFNIDGTFIWNSDSGTDMNCLALIGFEDFTGNWTLENNNTEIHITPPWFTNQGQTETVLRIISLDETDLTAETPNQTGGSTTIVWRRL